MSIASKDLQQLQRELLWLALLGIGLLLVMAACFAVMESLAFALRWLPAGLLCWAFAVWQCQRRLHCNYSIAAGSAGKPYASLGHGTRITLLRGLLIAATAGFLATIGLALRPVSFYIPALLYTLAALGDALDGHLARRQQQSTQLGAELDTVLDALGLLVAPLLAVAYGKLHVSYLLVSLAYYFFQWGIRWRQRHGKPVYPLPPSWLRRQLAGWQMALVATVLWPPLPAEMTRVAGVIFMLPVLAGFCVDWLSVSGRRGIDGRQGS